MGSRPQRLCLPGQEAALNGYRPIPNGPGIFVIARVDVLDKEKRKMLTSLLLNSKLDQAIVLATSEEAPPSIVPQGVKFLSLVEGLNPEAGTASTAACRQRGTPVRFDGGT